MMDIIGRIWVLNPDRVLWREGLKKGFVQAARGVDAAPLAISPLRDSITIVFLPSSIDIFYPTMMRGVLVLILMNDQSNRRSAKGPSTLSII